ncbi:hypothetical protein PF969_002786, partial [Enterococcus faecalis]|nr:hypothetical protein [Enterococcus faecalis]
FLKTVSSDLKCIQKLFFKDLSKLNIREEAIVFELDSESKNLELEPQLFVEYKPSQRQEIYKIFSSNGIYYEKEGFNYEESQMLRAKKLKEVFDEHSDELLQLFNVLAEYQLDELLNKHEMEGSISVLYSNLGIEDKAKMLMTLLNSNFTFAYHNFDYYMEKLPFEKGQNVLNSVEKELDERWYLSNLLT